MKKKSAKTCTTLSVYYLKDWIRFSLISGWLFLDTSAEAPRYWILSFPCAYVNCSTIPTHIRHYVGCGLRVFDDGWQLLTSHQLEQFPLFLKITIALFFSPVSLKFLPLLHLDSFLLPVTKNAMHFCIMFSSQNLFKEKQLSFLFFFSLCHSVSSWKAGVCLPSMFQGGFEGLFF